MRTLIVLLLLATPGFTPFPSTIYAFQSKSSQKSRTIQKDQKAVWVPPRVITSRDSDAGQKSNGGNRTQRQPAGNDNGSPVIHPRTSPAADPTRSQTSRPEDQRPGSRIADSGGHNWGTTAGIAAGAALAAFSLGRAMGAEKDPAKVLSEKGPQFPSVYPMHSVVVHGFAKGNWPVVLDYEMQTAGLVLITVVAEGVEPYLYRLEPAAVGRRIIQIRLPPRFGPAPQPAVYTLRASSEGPGELLPISLRVYGFGAGERAVGSVAIDEVRFGPDLVRPKRQDALYSFRARNMFTTMSAEFLRVEMSGGTIVASFQNSESIDPDDARPDRTPKQFKWEKAKRAKPGPHLVQIRAWQGTKGGSDWVVAWSNDIVRVEE